MTKTEKNLLSHLKPMTEYADTYFCSIAKNNKNCYIDTVEEKVKAWVEIHGGKFQSIQFAEFSHSHRFFLSF